MIAIDPSGNEEQMPFDFVVGDVYRVQRDTFCSERWLRAGDLLVCRAVCAKGPCACTGTVAFYGKPDKLILKHVIFTTITGVDIESLLPHTWLEHADPI